MKKYYSSRSSIFLIELIISIFFFIVSMSIILQIFAKSHYVSQSSSNLNNIILYSQNISECFLSYDGDFSSLKNANKSITCNTIYTDNTYFDLTNSNTMLILFDNDWNIVPSLEFSTYGLITHYRTESASDYGNFHVLDLYFFQSPQTLCDYIIAGSYDTLSSLDNCIHHMSIQKYVRKENN